MTFIISRMDTDNQNFIVSFLCRTLTESNDTTESNKPDQELYVAVRKKTIEEFLPRR